MNLKLLAGLAALLLIAGIIIILQSQPSEPGPSDAASLQDKNARTHSTRPQADCAANSFRFLQSLPELDLNSPPTFASIEARTADLTIGQIEALLAEHTSHEGLTGWLRSGLWAELGKRNHRPTIEALLSRLEGEDSTRSNFPDDQAIFAFLRGRMEHLSGSDETLDSIIEDFNNLGTYSEKQKESLLRNLSREFKHRLVEE